MERRITLVRLRKPARQDLNEELQWLGTSIGLFNLRDRDKSCFRIFIELIKSTRSNKKLSSDELAFRLNLSRGTVVHHLNKLREAGIISVDKNRYILRADNLIGLVDEIQKDMKRIYDDLKKVAGQIDLKLK